LFRQPHYKSLDASEALAELVGVETLKALSAQIDAAGPKRLGSQDGLQGAALARLRST
jgi:hypothetical protein